MSDIKDAAKGHWPQILSALAGLSEKQLRNKHQPCPLCGGKDRYRYDDRFQNGDWFCNQFGGLNGRGGAGDGFSMLMRRNDWTFKEAAQRVEEHLGLSHRVLALRAAPPLENAEAYWRYSSDFYVVRYPGKSFRPLTFNGQNWERKAPLSPRPLLNVDRLQAHPHAPVLLVEGEKTADAAQQLFTEAVVSTWPCGCKAVGKADFSPLKGRRVMLWPDADEVGIAAIKTPRFQISLFFWWWPTKSRYNAIQSQKLLWNQSSRWDSCIQRKKVGSNLIEKILKVLRKIID